MIEYISNRVDINVPDDYAFGCFFLRKLSYSELNSLLSEVLVTEEQTLSSDLLHSLARFIYPFLN